MIIHDAQGTVVYKGPQCEACSAQGLRCQRPLDHQGPHVFLEMPDHLAARVRKEKRDE